MKAESDYYTILQVDPRAESEVIKAKICSKLQPLTEVRCEECSLQIERDYLNVVHVNHILAYRRKGFKNLYLAI
ncbi:hypothetical protein ACFLV0_05875 [Chloroflexota bacterium]